MGVRRGNECLIEVLKKCYQKGPSRMTRDACALVSIEDDDISVYSTSNVNVVGLKGLH